MIRNLAFPLLADVDPHILGRLKRTVAWKAPIQLKAGVIFKNPKKKKQLITEARYSSGHTGNVGPLTAPFV